MTYPLTETIIEGWGNSPPIMDDTLRTALWRIKNPDKTRKQRHLYWVRLKADPTRYKAWLNKKKVWDKTYYIKHGIKGKKYSELTPEEKQRSYQRVQEWRKKHPEKRKEWNKRANDMKFYGGNREKVIQRDHEQCQECGLTRVEHYKKYKRDITVDHINRLGRGVKDKDNRLENLITLCLSCHLRKDGRINWKSDASN